MGLDFLSSLMQYRPYQALFNVTNTTGTYQAQYSTFHVGNGSTKFKLAFDGYTGNAGNPLKQSNNWAFSTIDRDHDRLKRGSCARKMKSGWWYNMCSKAAINGPCPNQAGYSRRGQFFMRWYLTSGKQPINGSEMLVRPVE